MGYRIARRGENVAAPIGSLLATRKGARWLIGNDLRTDIVALLRSVAVSNTHRSKSNGKPPVACQFEGGHGAALVPGIEMLAADENSTAEASDDLIRINSRCVTRVGMREPRVPSLP